MMASRRLALALLTCLALTACGGGDGTPDPAPAPGPDPSPAPSPSPTPTPPPAPGPEVILRGGERLAWDQVAASLQELRGYTFRLYVDGTQATLADTRCGDTRQAAGYECSGLLPALAPGRHVLQLTASGSGIESGRSAGLPVMVLNALVPDDEPGIAAPDGSLSTICVDAATECYSGRLVASGLGPVTAVTRTAGVQTLFIEDQRAVRAIDGSTLLEQPALVHDRPGGRLLGLAAAPDFEQSRAVYVAWTELTRAGDEQLSITRYRELRGVLGQGATVVTGLPLPRGSAALLAVDGAGMLYVALPAAATAADLPRGATTAFNSSVLRFNADGTVPRANPAPSPVLAQGYAQPEALVWDGAGGRLLLSGADPRSPVTVSAVPVTASQSSSPSAQWPWSPLAVVLEGRRQAGDRAPSLSLTGGVDPAARTLWVVSAPGVVQRAIVAAADYELQLADVGFGPLGAVTQVADGPAGSLFVVAADAAAGLSSVWSLSPVAR